jgi:hypothetical protein
VVATDVQASNGIIHVIDTVLLPGSVGAPSGAKQVCNVVEEGGRSKGEKIKSWVVVPSF